MLKEGEIKYGEILFSCVEEKLYKTEAIWEYHAFMRILSGEMKIVLADNSYTIGLGGCILIPRNQLSTVIKQSKDGKPYKSILVLLRPERLKEYYTRNDYKPTQPQKQKLKAFDKHPLLESFFASLLPYFDLESELPEKLVSVKVEEAITILRSIDTNTDSLLADFSEPGKINLSEFMQKNFMFNMPLEKYAYLTGRSIAAFNRDFRKIFQTSPQKWLTQKRLELAHYQLSEKKRKPVEVYIETGFENLSHFSFAFKKHFGYAPTKIE